MSREREYRRLRESLVGQFPRFPRRDAEVPVGSAPSKIETRHLVRSATRPALFDYQEDLIEQVQDVIRGKLGGASVATYRWRQDPHGIAAILAAMSEGHCRRVVWLAPSVELLDQAMNTFAYIWRDFGCAPDLVLSRRRALRAGDLVWFVTPQAVHSAVSRSRQVGGWDMVLFDEAHQLGARTYGKAVADLRGGGGGVPLVGLSATPGRTSPGETADLIETFGGRLLRSKRLGANPVAALQRRGVLARLLFRRFSERTIPREEEAERIAVAARAAQELFRRGRHLLVFTASVAGAYVLQDLLEGLGVPAQAVDAGSSHLERAAALDAFARRETAVLINQRLLATGYDCPAVTDVFPVAGNQECDSL